MISSEHCHVNVLPRFLQDSINFFYLAALTAVAAAVGESNGQNDEHYPGTCGSCTVRDNSADVWKAYAACSFISAPPIKYTQCVTVCVYQECV